MSLPPDPSFKSENQHLSQEATFHEAKCRSQPAGQLSAIVQILNPKFNWQLKPFPTEIFT